ncbi:unnamed protein product [Acanthoscelides obtectus]|uniref:Uncharacterized protein n=1 Tax=Acanthoscelides obtectus TaxID=200917 RepID=A0A9P0LVC2_ACAOB|nr:unnamed protein product [Acanthoscelides obtectus]CAK1642408.1 hypothetical protein AOBTE_LOCUS13017 [Acanthoscelides obtectus]
MRRMYIISKNTLLKIFVICQRKLYCTYNNLKISLGSIWYFLHIFAFLLNVRAYADFYIFDVYIL